MTDFNAAMRKAANLTRTYNLLDATRVIQDALTGRQPSAPGDKTATPSALLLQKLPVHAAANSPEMKSIAPVPGELTSSATGNAAMQTKSRRKPLGEVVRILREGRRLASLRPFNPPTQVPQVQTPAGAQFITRSFSSAAGARNYKLYIPAANVEQPRGLIVMLHGCNQNPDDFAVGTAMNDLAERHGFLVAYPHQARSHNPSSCWNWFRPSDQIRGQGEPAILAGIASLLAAEFNLGRDQNFVAGLSAGGAMAMVLAETYPDLFEGVGVHSGLAYKSANDVASAFSAMQGAPVPHAVRTARDEFTVRTIVFHGARDQTVHPSNAEHIAARCRGVDQTDRSNTQRGEGYVRVKIGPDEAPLFEKWSVDGLGHAWSGGNEAGSFTDKRGPDASAEMVRFFMQPHLP